MTDKNKLGETNAAALAGFGLQAGLEQAEAKNKNLERSLSKLSSNFAVRYCRFVAAPAAYFRRRIRSYKAPETIQLKGTSEKDQCKTEGAGGYLLSAVVDGYDSKSLLKMEFYDFAGDCSYYYKYPLIAEEFCTSFDSGVPVVRDEGSQTKFEVVIYIGNEIAYLRAVIVDNAGDELTLSSFCINRILNSGQFGHATKPVWEAGVSPLTIACILDEFTWTCLSPEASLIQLRPDTDWEFFDWTGFDLLLVESAWRGEGGVWAGALGGENVESRKALESMLVSCRESGVPSVFWNKEDPVHFEFFKSIAAKFDHIFTTDELMVERYQNEVSNANVYCLPFFIQPKIHNPMKSSRELINKVCFAGTWYGSHHANRTKAMRGVLDAAVPLGLDIYDRMYLATESDYRFPMRYWQHIKGKLTYQELCEAHKYYACFININTVANSPSMCARRVFEVLASSTPVVSNPSLSLERYFKGGVLAAHNQGEATAHFSRLLSDRTYRALQGHLGFRSVMGKHTARERLNFIAEKLGKSHLVSKPQDDSITFISIANCEEDIQSIQTVLRKFSTPELKLLLGITFSRDLRKAENFGADVLIVPVAESGLKSYEILLNKVDSRFALTVNLAVEYGANYVSDKLLCFAFMREPVAYSHPRFIRCDSGIACRESVPEHEFTHNYDIDSLVIDLENEFWNTEVGSRDVGWLESAISRLSANKRIYATDSFNFLKLRGEASTSVLRERLAGYSEQDVFI